MAAPTPDVPAPALFDLAATNVLITGASRGIGLAAAHALAQAGASICAVVRDAASAPPIPGARHVVCDLADADAVRGVFERALELMGGEIHVLVNCAGIQRRAPSVAFSEQDWDDVLAVNLKAVWLLCQAAGQHMVPRGRGKIINLGSLLSLQGGLTVPAYAAAKGALAQLTKALSNEWAAHGVQVNALCPGYVDTAMNTALLADAGRRAQIDARIPAGRWGVPADFAGPVVFLASAASQYVSGTLLVVDGGWMAR